MCRAAAAGAARSRKRRLDSRRVDPNNPRPSRSKARSTHARLRDRVGLARTAVPNAPVAQLDRVPGYELGGREFESLRARHLSRDAGGSAERRRRRLRRLCAGAPRPSGCLASESPSQSSRPRRRASVSSSCPRRRISTDSSRLRRQASTSSSCPRRRASRDFDPGKSGMLAPASAGRAENAPLGRIESAQPRRLCCHSSKLVMPHSSIGTSPM